jgi:hypothetical protein
MASETRLMLLIGPGVPVPAPAVVTDALESVQITSGTDRSGFQLVFRASKWSPLLGVMLPAGYLDPITTRVIVIVVVGGIPHVLMDGIVTRHDISPANEPGASTVTVTGEDLSVLMDLVQMPFMRFPAQPGIAPIAIPPVIPDTTSPLDELPSQRGTDLDYLRELAADCGYVFYVEPGPAPGSSIAYWGPDVRIPIPQPALSIDMDAHTNVESMSFNLDGTAKRILVLSVMDPVTKKIPIPLPIPNISVLRPPLGLRPTPPAKVEFPSDLGALSPTAAISKALGYSFAASDAIRGSGTLDVSRYGRPLRSRMLVGVRGAGLAYDGLYYVNSVTHDLKRGSYKQSFSVSRDGLITNTPLVPVGSLLP